MPSTYFGLLAEFETPEVPLSEICEKYFGCKHNEAKRRAARRSLPIPVHKIVKSQKAEYMVAIDELAAWIDKQKEIARADWEAHNDEEAA